MTVIRYRSLWSALQVPDEFGNCDWHSNLIDVSWLETEDTWGIFDYKGQPTASHARAMYDLVEVGRFQELEGIVEDLDLPYSTQLEFVRRVYSRYGNVLRGFMIVEFLEAWEEVTGTKIPKPFTEAYNKWKEAQQKNASTE